MSQRLTSQNICRSVTYISWFSDFTQYLVACLMEECYIWDNGSVGHIDWPQKGFKIENGCGYTNLET